MSVRWSKSKQRYVARYRDLDGEEHSKLFPTGKKGEGVRWVAEQKAALTAGTWVNPATGKMTVGEWCDIWLAAYSGRPGTLKMGRVHVARIKEGLGTVPIRGLKSIQVKAWCKELADQEYAPSYVYALYSRLSQIMIEAVDNDIAIKNPCTRKIAPPMGKQKPYVARPEMIWALLDAMPDHFQPAILLGAFSGLRIGEAVGCRIDDVDFMRAKVTPVYQHNGQPLKTPGSGKTVNVSPTLPLKLAAYVQRYGGTHLVTDGLTGGPVPSWRVERAFRKAKREVRKSIPDLPQEFSHHDLRHFFASALIAGGADIKVVQAKMRHDSIVTTMRDYAHMFPDSDERGVDILTAAMERPSEAVDHVADDPSVASQG